MPHKVLKTYLKSQIKRKFSLKIGDIYFFDDFVIVEYAENSHITLSKLEEIIIASREFYAHNKPFGLIVNKIHTFSTVPTDAKKLEQALPNLIATAVVTWDPALSINFDLENHFFQKMTRELFPDIESAEKWIQHKIKNFLVYSTK